MAIEQADAEADEGALHRLRPGRAWRPRCRAAALAAASVDDLFDLARDAAEVGALHADIDVDGRTRL